MIINGFAPIADVDAKILILGSMPGVASLEAHQYYAHKRNAFWPLMARLLDEDLSFDYQAKVAMLLRHSIALWDVIRCCERRGSSDSTIRNALPNDFTAFWNTHKAIALICCNGTTAYHMAKKFNITQGMSTYDNRPSLVMAPSTSCANTIPFDEKLECWQRILANVSGFLPR